MNKKWMVIGDIHGRFDMLERILLEREPDETLVFIGDYIDRGPDSKRVLDCVRKLREEEGAILLKGNHEDMLLQWLEHPEHNAMLYLPQGGYQTLESFFGRGNVWMAEPALMAEKFQKEFGDYVRLMRQMYTYYDEEEFVFLHAGVDLTLKNWHASRASDFLWMREPFFYLPNHTGNTFVFGHTPTRSLHADKSDTVWVSPDNTRIGIDGGAVFGGLLHGLHIDGDSFRVSSVTQAGEVQEQVLARQNVNA